MGMRRLRKRQRMQGAFWKRLVDRRFLSIQEPKGLFVELRCTHQISMVRTATPYFQSQNYSHVTFRQGRPDLMAPIFFPEAAGLPLQTRIQS